VQAVAARHGDLHDGAGRCAQAGASSNAGAATSGAERCGKAGHLGGEKRRKCAKENPASDNTREKLRNRRPHQQHGPETRLRM
jgi:hypothetical protein